MKNVIWKLYLIMEDARKLYKKVGFESLENPMGDTGHYNCDMWMIKTL